MSMHFRDLAEQAMADGAISAEEILGLRQSGWDDGCIDAGEAEALFVLGDHLKDHSPEWTDYFVDALCEYAINGTGPKGYVDDATADWLIERISSDGRVDSMAELELLVHCLERATSVPQKLRDFALEQIEQTVLSGTGPTRDGGSLEAGRISQSETHLLRRMIFAAGGDRPAAVSRTEAEMLFRLKDATLGKANAGEWQRLFVQGVGNYLMGFGGEEQLSQERATELESFMNDARPSLGGFFWRMAKTPVEGGIAGLFTRKAASPTLESQVDAAQAIDASEQLWLQGKLDADGQLDDLEKALLAFIAEDGNGA
jgi:hypothetical protein